MYRLTIAQRPASYIQNENTRLPLKNIWRLVGMNFFLFYSGYHAPTLFRNLQKRYLVCSERGTL